MYLDKPIVLRDNDRRSRRRGPGPSRGGSVFVVVGLALLNFFLFFDGAPDSEAPTLEERLYNGAPSGLAPALPGADTPKVNPGTPQVVPEFEERDDFGEPVGRTVAGRLKHGQSILIALKQEGIDSRTALPLIREMETIFDFRQAQVGNTFELMLDDEGQIQRFTYTQSPLDIYEATRRDDGAYDTQKKAVPTHVDIARIGCTIKSSLYESMSRCGGGPRLAALFIDLFAWDVDFFQDARAGDEFRIIVERISVDGRFLKYGDILAAEYRGKFGHHRIVHYADPDGRDGYYTADGRSVEKQFLKTPLKYTRASSRSGGGIRGSLKKAAPVVYTSNAGTPVWAVSHGTVVFAGKSGSLGKTVTIRHDGGYTSTYGHLEKLGRHIRVGKRVNQKSVIGTVGQTGRASEPQLLFSLRRNGKLQNPLQLRFTEGEPVVEEHMEHFQRSVEDLVEDLETTEIIGITKKRS